MATVAEMWRCCGFSRCFCPGGHGCRRRRLLIFLGIVLLLGQLLIFLKPQGANLARSGGADIWAPLYDQPHRRDTIDNPVSQTIPAPTSSVASRSPLLIVVIATFPRSGSSLLGELLTVATRASYFFEPFFYHAQHNIKELSDSLVTKELSDLLTCRLMSSAMMRDARFRLFIWKTGAPRPRVPYSARYMEKRCNASWARVVKVFRPRLRSVLRLLDDEQLGPHVRLVHLLRDPRAVVNSQLNNTAIWTNAARDAADTCVRLSEDLALVAGLKDGRYTRVHYEQLAASPRQTAARLMRQLALPVTPQLQLFLDQHWNQTSVQTVLQQASHLDPSVSAAERRARWRRRMKAMRSRNYFSTFRDSQFDPSHWQQELDPQIRALLEAECPDALQTLERDRLRTGSVAEAF